LHADEMVTVRIGRVEKNEKARTKTA